MNIITLKTDGLMVHEGRVVEGEPLAFLPFKTQLEDGYKLRSSFWMLQKYPLLTKLSLFFPDYMRRFAQCPPEGCVTSDFDLIEVSKTVEMIGFPGEPQLEIYISFKGLSGTEAYPLNRYRMENLLDMPVKLGILKHIVFGDKMDVFEFETVFTLFEFLDGIAWELSFQTGSTECQMRR